MIKIRIALVALAATVALVCLKRCNRDPNPDTSVTLASGEKEKVVLGNHKITVVKRLPDGSTKTETQYVPDKASVVYKDDGQVVVTVKQIGWTLNGGMGVFAVPGKGGAVAFDAQLAYYKRMGLHVGFGAIVGAQPKSVKQFVDDYLVPFVAVGYRMPFDMVSNTSVLVGYAPMQKTAIAGIRIQF